MQIVCDTQSFLAGHDSISFVPCVILLFKFTETFPREHTSPVVIGENSVAANVLEILGCNTLTIFGLHNVGQVNCWLLRYGILVIN